MILLVFWTAAFLILFIYAGYPAALFFWARLRPRPVAKADSLPSVTIVIAAYNEESCLEATLSNKLAFDYPADRLEVIVVSDGSTDRTEDIARSFAPRVRLLIQDPRQGKTAGLNKAVAAAAGEIVMFSDANSLHDPAALRRLVRNFADGTVGYVTGKMVYVDETGSLIGSGCDAYMRYENVLRSLETAVGSVVGVDGGVDAARRSLYEPMSPDMLPDFVLPLKVVEKGFRVVYEESALLRENALSDAGDETRMRVRVTLRSFHALWAMRRLFNPLVGGLFSFQLLVHKLMRYLVGYLQVLLFAAAAALWARGPLYRAAVAAQGIFYGLALLGHLLTRLGKSINVAKYPYYFCLLNACAVAASWRFLRGEKKVLWQPRKG